jgi:hypothetical protein
MNLDYKLNLISYLLIVCLIITIGLLISYVTVFNTEENNFFLFQEGHHWEERLEFELASNSQYEIKIRSAATINISIEIQFLYSDINEQFTKALNTENSDTEYTFDQTYDQPFAIHVHMLYIVNPEVEQAGSDRLSVHTSFSKSNQREIIHLSVIILTLMLTIAFIELIKSRIYSFMISRFRAFVKNSYPLVKPLENRWDLAILFGVLVLSTHFLQQTSILILREVPNYYSIFLANNNLFIFLLIGFCFVLLNMTSFVNKSDLKIFWTIPVERQQFLKYQTVIVSFYMVLSVLILSIYTSIIRSFILFNINPNLIEILSIFLYHAIFLLFSIYIMTFIKLANINLNLEIILSISLPLSIYMIFNWIGQFFDLEIMQKIIVMVLATLLMHKMNNNLINKYQVI